MSCNKNNYLRGDEYIENLNCIDGGGYYVIQNPTRYKINQDSLFLARFAIECGGLGTEILELGSGCGEVSFMLASAIKAHIVGVEIDPDLFSMASRSAAINGFTKGNLPFVEFVNADIKHFKGKYNSVITNPPFFQIGKGRLCKTDAQARFEVKATFDDFFKAAASSLNTNGILVYTQRIERLNEGATLADKYGFTLDRQKINGKVYTARLIKTR